MISRGLSFQQFSTAFRPKYQSLVRTYQLVTPDKKGRVEGKVTGEDFWPTHSVLPHDSTAD